MKRMGTKMRRETKNKRQDEKMMGDKTRRGNMNGDKIKIYNET